MGAAVTLTRLMRFLKDQIEARPAHETETFRAVVNQLRSGGEGMMEDRRVREEEEEAGAEAGSGPEESGALGKRVGTRDREWQWEATSPHLRRLPTNVYHHTCGILNSESIAVPLTSSLPLLPPQVVCRHPDPQCIRPRRQHRDGVAHLGPEPRLDGGRRDLHCHQLAGWGAQGGGIRVLPRIQVRVGGRLMGRAWGERRRTAQHWE